MIRTIHRQLKLTATGKLSDEYIPPVPGFIVSVWLGFPATTKGTVIQVDVSPSDGTGTYRKAWASGEYIAATTSKNMIATGTGDSGYTNITSWLYGWHGAIKIASNVSWDIEANFDFWIRYIPDAEIEASTLAKPGLGVPAHRP